MQHTELVLQLCSSDSLSSYAVQQQPKSKPQSTWVRLYCTHVQSKYGTAVARVVGIKAHSNDCCQHPK
jgi:hypothetical protein